MSARLGKVIVAPHYEAISAPLIFIAGPIWGAGNWQDEAISIIVRLAPEISIANPFGKYETKEFDADFQVDWETRYLHQAATYGCILFWLAKEKTHLCHRAFAQTSRFELGEWKERHRSGGARIVLGIEAGFTGEPYIKRRLGQECPFSLTIHSSLEDTCIAAISCALRKHHWGFDRPIL